MVESLQLQLYNYEQNVHLCTIKVKKIRQIYYGKKNLIYI